MSLGWKVCQVALEVYSITITLLEKQYLIITGSISLSTPSSVFLNFLFSFMTFDKKLTQFFGEIFVLQNSRIRQFRPNLVHWNESVYCTSIDRELKIRFNKGSGNFPPPTIQCYIQQFFGSADFLVSVERIKTIV